MISRRQTSNYFFKSLSFRHGMGEHGMEFVEWNGELAVLHRIPIPHGLNTVTCCKYASYPRIALA